MKQEALVRQFDSPSLLISINSISRPKNKRRKKSYYSGKKKKHTVKTQFMVNSEGIILHKTGREHGRKHDYEVFKNNHPTYTAN